MDKYDFGYPRECKKCAAHATCSFQLNVSPYLQEGGTFRLMLIGQDPTITHGQERVESVLMLDRLGGQLSRWLSELFGANHFRSATLYATNAVKCTFGARPSAQKSGGLRFLQPYFELCNEHLLHEISTFRPSLVMTLGEPAHALFVSLLETPHNIQASMKQAFTGRFFKVTLGGVEFDYSPCLHISTFRVAEAYGDAVKKFKTELKSYVSVETPDRTYPQD